MIVVFGVSPVIYPDPDHAYTFCPNSGISYTSFHIAGLFGSHPALNISSQGHARRGKMKDRQGTAAVYTCTCMLRTNSKEKAKSRKCNVKILFSDSKGRPDGWEISMLARKSDILSGSPEQLT